jgi:hypothetical protein
MIYEPNKNNYEKIYHPFSFARSSLLTARYLPQDIFISKGKIEFEKRVNIYKNLDDQRDNDDEGGFDWIGQMKKQMPEFNVTYFNLYFDGE